MLPWLAENAGTIVVALIVAGIVAAIIVKLVRDRSKGKCSCCDQNGGCGGCHGSHGGDFTDNPH